jgi:transposase
MHVIYERCCGIDVHKKFIVACLCIPTAAGAIQEAELEVLLVNAQHIKAVPGRKTDLKDAEWARP